MLFCYFDWSSRDFYFDGDDAAESDLLEKERLYFEERFKQKQKRITDGGTEVNKRHGNSGEVNQDIMCL